MNHSKFIMQDFYHFTQISSFFLIISNSKSVFRNIFFRYLPKHELLSEKMFVLEIINKFKFIYVAMAPHSSTLAWKIPWTEEPGGLLSMGLHRVRHD